MNFFVSKWKSGKQAGKRCIVTFCNTIFLLTSHLNFTILEKLPFSYVMILRQAVNCHSTSLNYSISVLAILSRALFLFAFRFRSRLALNYLTILSVIILVIKKLLFSPYTNHTKRLERFIEFKISFFFLTILF